VKLKSSARIQMSLDFVPMAFMFEQRWRWMNSHVLGLILFTPVVSVSYSTCFGGLRIHP